MTDGPATWHQPPEFPAGQPEGRPSRETLFGLVELTRYDGGYTMPGITSVLCIARADMLLEQVTPTSPPELFTEIDASLAEWEERFPGARLWDRMRSNMAVRMYDETHAEAATKMIHAMRSPHNQVTTLAAIGIQHPDTYDELFSGIMRQYQKDPDTTRLVRFLQAALDQVIEADPDHPAIGKYEKLLRSQDPAYDPVKGWIDSQREATPDMPSGKASSTLNDPRWKDTPMPWRMHMVKSAHYANKYLEAEVSTELVAGIIGVLDHYADRFPDTVMWDSYRVFFGGQLLDAGDPAFAFDFARSIRDIVHQHWMAEIFMSKGYTGECAELWGIVQDRIRRGDTGNWEAKARI